jgi:hypothetical protein
VFALLIHQLNTGNLSPANLEWAATQMRGWSRKLELVALPKSMEGFFVDLAGRTGLARRTGQDSGAMLRYLDTSALAEQLDMALAALRHSEETDQGPVGPLNQQRAAILEKARAAIAPNLNTDLRRDPRTPCVVAARVRIGLARIQRELSRPAGAASTPSPDTLASSEQIEVYAVAGPVRAQRETPDEADTLSASLAAIPDPVWQVKDRSVAGLRIYASSGAGQALLLGALTAVRQSDGTGWVLGVVRRLNKLSTDEVEGGVSLIADHVVCEARGEGRHGRHPRQWIRRIDAGPENRGALPAAAVASRQAARREDGRHPDVRVRGGPPGDPDDRPLGVHGRAAATGRAARRLELGGAPDRREAPARLSAAYWSSGRKRNSRLRWNRSAGAGFGSGDAFRIARCTASSYA